MEFYNRIIELNAQVQKRLSEGESLPRRERERLARRREILDGGRHLFARKGYHMTTLDDVAEAVELGKATLYSYFDSKERLFESVLEDAFIAMQMIGEEALLAEGSIEERIRDFIGAELLHFFRHPSTLRLMMSEAHQLRGRNPMLKLMPQLIRLIADQITEAQRQGEVLPHANALDLAVMLFNMLQGQLMSRIYKSVIADMDSEEVKVLDERVAGAFRELDPATIETIVISVTDLICTVYFTGIKVPIA
jgi:AcrR family transcriptional regulator